MPVSQQENFNLASLVVNDVYIVVAPPVSTSVQGVDTGIVGYVGGASWGPVGVGLKAGSPAEAARNWGPLVNQPNDLMTDAVLTFQQGVQAVVGVRAADGTEATATANLVTAAKGTVTIAGTPHTGDIVTITLDGKAVAYTTTAGDTTATLIATSVTSALNADPEFANLAFAESSAAVITITSKSSSNSTTLVVAVTGSGATVTATASGATLANGGTTILPVNGLYPGAEGNNISFSTTRGSNYTPAAPTWTVRVSRHGISPGSEVFENLPQATLGAALKAALSNGQGPRRGVSELVAGGTVGAGTTAPAQTETSLTGGANGDTGLTTSNLLGSAIAIPNTGMYALARKGVQQFGLCGCTDSAAWSSMIAWGKANGALAVLACPSGTTTAAAIALKKSAGVDSEYACLVKDFVQFLDTSNAVMRLIAPTAFALGRIASLNPRESPGNKPIVGVLATERTLAKREYTPTELDDLFRNGIMIITNDLPGGSFFGLRHGLNTSSNNAINGVEYTRMTNFIAYSLNQAFGAVIDQVQSTQPNDPLRAKVQKKLNNFFTKLKSPEVAMIDDFSVDMSFGAGKINTVESVGEGFMKAKVRVKYLSIVRFFTVFLTGGKTVEVTVSAA